MESEIALPGRIAADRSGGAADVRIRSGRVPEFLEGAIAAAPTWQMTDRFFVLRIPGVARFLLCDGDTILFEPAPGTPVADLAIFLLGTVFGVLLHQRKYVVLHASAVCVAGRAVLFCGASGAGKSTIAAALGRCGYPLVTDDVCAVTLDRVPVIHPDGRQLKLWSEAIDALDLAAARHGPVRQCLEKYYVQPGFAHPAPAPVGAIYVLREPRPPATFGIEPLNPADSAAILHEQAYRRRLVAQMGQTALYFRAAIAIANAAGVFYLTRAMDFADMDRVVALLEDHWRAIGLEARAA
ncbi:MAG: hypothetical protein WDN03_10450 [Rhizomicrobium sp.]